MAQLDKLFDKLRRQPHNVRFADLCRAAEGAGFQLKRIRGSHRWYRHPDYPDVALNLQPEGGKAKRYQVLQFLNLIEEYNIGHG